MTENFSQASTDRPAPSGPAKLDPARLIGCPECDAVYTLSPTAKGQRADCARCGHQLIAPRVRAGAQIIALSLSIAILIIAAAAFPFLSISAGGLSNSVSVIEAAFIFADGILVLLALATIGLIVLIPLIRVLLSIYVLVPLVRDRPAAPGAMQAFRISEALQPWSMAEIFAIGCAVALVKITDLADVHFGPAFWLFCALVVLIVIQDRLLCRWSVWTALEGPRK